MHVQRTTGLLTLLGATLLASSSLFTGHGAEPLNPLAVKVVREYVRVREQARFQELMAEYGANKVLPPGYELQTLLALSHFPELKTTRIRFVLDDVDIPLSSRPHWASMLRSAGKRTYLVVIDSQRAEGREELLLGKQPFNAQIGIIGHELAHTIYYLDRSFLGILDDGLCQFSSCRISFERNTDKRTVDYGLGWQRFDHSVFLRRRRGVDPFAVPRPGSAYLAPSELLDLMVEHPAYQATLAGQDVRGASLPVYELEISD